MKWEVVDDQVHLIIDGHGRFNVPMAVRIGHAQNEYNILLRKIGTAGLLKKSSFLTKYFIKLPLNVHFQIFFANRKYQNNLL